MGWFDSSSNNDEEAAYQAASHANIPIAHAVAIASTDSSQDFVRPPPMNPSLQPYQATAMASPPVGRIIAANTKQPPVQSARVVSSRTCTIPAGSPLLQQQRPHQSAVAATQSRQEQPQDIEFTRRPQILAQCPQCYVYNARTRIRTYPSLATWCACLALLFIFWPLCWLPLVMDSMKQTDHYCLVCGKMVGSLPPFRNCCVKTRA